MSVNPEYEQAVMFDEDLMIVQGGDEEEGEEVEEESDFPKIIKMTWDNRFDKGAGDKYRSTHWRK